MGTLKPTRPDQETPAEIVAAILRAIRLQFCPDLSDKEWFKAHYHFIKMRAVLWPAAFMKKKGFSVPPERYKAILFGILQEIKRHGDTGRVQYWPAYLTKCIQDHFNHQWETYYQEAKTVRAATDRALLAFSRGSAPAPEANVDDLATAVAVLRSPGGKKRRPVKMEKQLGLF